MSNKEYDVYRDSYWRYLGYANEVGEAFRPLVPNSAVRASYLVAVSYVAADTVDKVLKTYNRNSGVGKAAITGTDVFIWQMLASVLVPGFTINRITWLTSRILQSAKANKSMVRTVPTAAGLCAIPLIVQPIDRLIDYFMDNTFRKIF